MKTAMTVFICAKCDAQTSKWSGRCLECGTWGSLGASAAGDTGPKGAARLLSRGKPAAAVRLGDLGSGTTRRVLTGIGEFDRVLGGGLVPGSLVLVSGEPGIGKSTLLLQTAAALEGALYVSGEESADQIAMRFKRLGLASPTLKFVPETDFGVIAATIEAEKPSLAIIDSIQTTTASDIGGETGGVSQIRGVTAGFMELAKRTGVPLLIVGQVTKDGAVAGPKMLEHLVDVVISFEGDRASNYRLLRTVKNRFGSTDEIGVFEMAGSGLKEVANPSSFFLTDRTSGVPGSVVTCIMEGTRPILVEIQALASRTTFGYPQRRAAGFDSNRLQVLLAVMTERLGINTGTHDIHLNVAGGYRVSEPAADAAVILAIASAITGKPLPSSLAAFGEVGLGGELRPVPLADRRLTEAKRLGFKETIAPPETKNLTAVLKRLLS
jgi:DNA repair protein RadA/Sms